MTNEADLASLAEAKILLVEALLEAARAKMDDGDPPENGPRAVCHAAVVAVSEYLRNIGIDYRLRKPMFDLIAAFDDANIGIANPLFVPAPHTSGTSTMGRDALITNATAAALVTVLHTHDNMTVTDAANLVAARVTLDAKKIIEFRKNVSRRRPDGQGGHRSRAPSEAVELYSSVISHFLEMRQLDPAISGREYADIMAAKL